MDTSKIIKGVVSNGRYTVTAPIVKEDYGLYLKIEGVELPSTYEVDFSNSENNGTSVTMIGNSDGVLIPRQFIDSGKDVFAFLYHVGEDFGRTVYKFRIPNKVRPDRTEETPTPEEQSLIDQAIGALNEAVAQTAQDVIDADASTQSASQSAENAHDSAVDAQNYAESAQTSANNASASASQASASATASANSASQAQGYTQSASASAQSASTSASDALTYANTASTKASEASTSAQTASQKATEASQSASQALTYKTDAESAKTASQTAQGLAESARDSAITAKNDAESARDDAVQAKTDVQNIADGIDTRLVDVESALIDKAPVITDTASGSIASFTDGANDLPLKSLIVDIDPIQDLSNGDPSPENICPISGWTQVDVEQRGVNVWDEEWEVYGSSGQIKSKNRIPVIEGATYFLKSPTGCTMYLFPDATSPNVGYVSAAANKTFTIPQGVHYITMYTTVNYGTTYNHDISINYPSTDHDYHPYTGRSLTIQLGQTVYGGKLDVLSGELTVDRANIASYNGETLPSTWISDRDVYASGTTPTTGAQVVYQLATPIEIQLTPQQVNSLLGVNNIWADTGDTEVVYRADTKLYISKKIAEAISALS